MNYTYKIASLIALLIMLAACDGVNSNGNETSSGTKVLPDFASYSDVKAKKAAFFDYLYPMINRANQAVLNQRAKLLEVSDGGKSVELSGKDQRWVVALAAEYDVAIGDQVDLAAIAELIRRVDYVSPSLAMAQAANESAWGTSKFAKQAYNLFGIWCYTEGCGIVPSSRNAGATHEVRRFDSPQASVNYYIKLINSAPAYSEVRAIRAEQRNEEKVVAGTELAKGLIRYSERGEDYIEEIQQMIRFNKLSQYSESFFDTL